MLVSKVKGLWEDQSRKMFIVIVGIISVLNSTLGSSLPSGAISFIATDFNVTNDQQLVLPISLFLVGYVLGPVFFGPLSETYGRRIVLLSSLTVFTLFTMACALAPNWPSFLVFRLLCGISASSPMAVIGGLYADIFSNPVTRGRALAIFMAVSMPDIFCRAWSINMKHRLQHAVPNSRPVYLDSFLSFPGDGPSG